VANALRSSAARERSNRLGLPGCLLGRQLVLGRRRFQLLQLQLELIEQTLLALRRWP
jgi:hypothetical protein